MNDDLLALCIYAAIVWVIAVGFVVGVYGVWRGE